MVRLQLRVDTFRGRRRAGCFSIHIGRLLFGVCAAHDLRFVRILRSEKKRVPGRGLRRLEQEVRNIFLQKSKRKWRHSEAQTPDCHVFCEVTSGARKRAKKLLSGSRSMS